MSTIQNAIQSLLSVCDGARTKDGVGFNSFDSRLVRTWNLSSLTAWQERTAYRLLAKYTTQLAGHWGIDYSKIPTPPLPLQKPSNRIGTASNLFSISFTYDPALVVKIKEIPGRKWNALDKMWSAPLSSAAEVAEFAIQNKFEILPTAADSLSAILEKSKENIKASQSQEASQEFVLVPGLGGTLRPFQVAGVEYASKKKRAFICDEMGLGKTIEALATIHQLNTFPALIICPASLKLNWEREAKKWLPGKSVSVINGKNNGNGFSSDVVIMNYDILSKHFTLVDKKTAAGSQLLQIEQAPMNPQAVVLDESHYCFPYETKIMTDQGPLSIGKIVEEKLNVSVLSCNLSNNVLEYKHVQNYFKNALHSPLIEVIHEYGKFICTANHKIWTQNGYVEAGTLTSDALLRMVQTPIRDANQGTVNGKILLQSLQSKSSERPPRSKTEIKCISQKTPNSENLQDMPNSFRDSLKRESKCQKNMLWKFLCCQNENARPKKTGASKASRQKSYPSQYRMQTPRRIIKNENQQSYVQTGNFRKNAAIKEGSAISIQGGKWQNNYSPIKFSSSPTKLVYGTSCVYAQGKTSFFTDTHQLQSRHSQYKIENSNRSRRPCTQTRPKEEIGQKENERLTLSRVVRIEILQSGNSQQSSQSPRDHQAVYNVEVADNHNYFAADILVSNCKNSKAKRTQLCRAIAKLASVRICLTGTPVLNRPQELLSQLQLLGRLEELGGFWEFAKRYCGASHGKYGWDFSGATNTQELNEKLRTSCYIRRKKEDVLKELPAKQRTTISVALSNQKEYNQAQNNLYAWLRENKGKEAAEAAGLAEHLVKIEALKQVAAKGKIEAAQEWIESFLETGEKLVVFAHHTNIVEQIASIFSAPSITGSTPIEKRQEYVDRFQNDTNCKIIVCNIKAGGVGITLTASSNVLFLEQDWTPAAHDQAEDRCHRIGQNDSVTAWYLLGKDTIDEDINKLIEQKRQVVDAVTEGQEGEQSSVLKALIEKISGGHK